jgi:hypothetical protein
MQPNIPSNEGEKILNYIMCGRVLPHEHNEICVSNLWHGCINIEKDHNLCDGGGLIWCIMIRKKLLEAILKDGMIRWVERHI